MSDGAPQTHDNSNNICSSSSERPALNQSKTLQLPLYHNIPNTVTLDYRDSPFSPDGSRGSWECLSGCEWIAGHTFHDQNRWSLKTGAAEHEPPPLPPEAWHLLGALKKDTRRVGKARVSTPKASKRIALEATHRRRNNNKNSFVLIFSPQWA